MSEKDIPNDIWKSAAVYEKNTATYHHMDNTWGYLQKLKRLLGKIALSVLTIPHSNAAGECMFSMIKKRKTEFRANLELSKSLDSTMAIKMNSPEPCRKMRFLKKLLESYISACWEHNK